MSKLVIILLMVLNNRMGCLAAMLRGVHMENIEFPWLIQFETIIPCGGILITPDWVLTAAQCVQSKRNSIALFAGGLNGTESRQSVRVKATYIYPRYRAYKNVHDHDHNIALLKLSQPYNIGDSKVQLLDIAPVRLDDVYSTCLIFGWQSYVAPSTKVFAKPILYSQILLKSWEFCRYTFDGNISYDNVFCATVKTENGLKACAGNPGSPVVCEDKYQRVILLGIASWSNYSLQCGGIPAYLSVSVFRSWIFDLIFKDKGKKEWNNVDVHKTAACDCKRYSGGSESRNETWTSSNSQESIHEWQIDYQENISKEQAKVDWKASQSQRVEKKLPKSLPDTSNITNLSRVINFNVLHPHFDNSQERGDTLKNFYEIGRNTEMYSKLDNAILVKYPKSGFSSQSLENDTYSTHARSDTRYKIDSDLEDLELEIPFNADYSNPSCSLYLFSLDQRIFMMSLFSSFLNHNSLKFSIKSLQ